MTVICGAGGTVPRNDYAIVIEPLAIEDGSGFIAFVPALPGCVSDGDTREEALANVQDAIQSWIGRAQAASRDVPPVREASGVRR